MKILFCLLLLNSLSFAGVWSSLRSSGIVSAYGDLNALVSSRNDEIKAFWDNNIRTLLTQIDKESQEKEKNLKQLEALKKELLLSKKELNFLLKQSNELLGIKANVNAM